MNTYIAEYQPWGKKVFQQFSSDERKTLLDGFRFNPTGWEILFGESRFSVCSQVFGRRAVLWTPLNISLVEYCTAPLLDNASQKDVQVLISTLINVAKENQKAAKSFSTKALEIAFHIQARLQNEKIRDILPFLSVYGDQENVSERNLWIHVFAILDSLLADPDSLYIQMLETEPSNDAIELVCTSILSQPQTIDQKKDRFLAIMGHLADDESVGIIQYLNYRGLKELAKPLAELALAKIDTADIFSFQLKKIPVYKRQRYFQEIDRYLVLCAISDRENEYQKGMVKFGRWLVEYGFAVRYAEDIILRSISLSSEQAARVLNSANFDDWETLLIHPFADQNQNNRDLLRFAHAVLQNTGEDINQFNELFLIASKNPVWCNHFDAIIEQLTHMELTPFLASCVLKLSKTAVADYGIEYGWLLNYAQDSLELSPADTLYWAWLVSAVQGESFTLQSQIMHAYAQLEDWPGVVETADWIQKKHHLTEEGSLLLAKAYLAIDEVEEAVSKVRSVLVKKPKNAQANLLMGMGYVAQKNYQLAIDHLGRAVEYDFENPAAWQSLAEAQEKLGRSDLAITTLQKGAAALPQEPQIAFTLSKLLSAQKDYTAAYHAMDGKHDYLIGDVARFSYLLDLLWQLDDLPYLQELVFGVGDRYADEKFIVFYRAKIYQLQHYFRDALSEISSYVEKNPDQDASLYNLYFEILSQYTQAFSYAVAYLNTHEIDELQKIISLVLVNMPEQVQYLLYQCEVQILQGQYQQALESLQNLLIHHTEKSAVNQERIEFDIALCSRYLEQYDTAMATFESLHQVHPENHDILMQIAETCLANQLPVQAEKYAARAFALNPSSQPVVDWYVSLMQSLKSAEQLSALIADLLDVYPDSLPLKKVFIRFNLQNKHEKNVQNELSRIVRDDLGINDADRVELVQYALESHSLTLAARLINAGSDSFELPVMLLVHYLLFLMAENQFEEAYTLIQKNKPRFKEHRLMMVLEADVDYYLQQYAQAEAILQELLQDTKQLRMPVQIFEDDLKNHKLHYSEEELKFHQSPAALFLRLALIARRLGKVSEFRTYTEKALAFDLNNPLNQYAFMIAVQINGDDAEITKLYQLLHHWQKPLLNALDRNDFLLNFRQNLLAESFLHANVPTGTQILVNASNISGKLTAKLQYALKRSAKITEKNAVTLQDFLTDFIRERQRNHQFTFENGLSSIFYQFMLDDLWIRNANSLDPSLVDLWPLVTAYYRENSTLENAHELYCDIGLRILLLESFLKEMKVTHHLPSHSLNLVEIADNISAFMPSILQIFSSTPVTALWHWYQAVQNGQTVLMDQRQLETMPDSLQSYYVFSARCTNTALPAAQFQILSTSISVESLMQLALIFLKEDRVSDAWSVIKQALGWSSQNPLVRYCYARIADELGQQDAAIEGIQTALQYWPNEPEWHRWLAEIALQTSRYDIAAAHLEYLWQEDQIVTLELIQLARTYIHQKAFNKASRMIAQIPELEDYHSLRTALLLLLAIKKNDVSNIQVLFRGLHCEDDISREAYLAMAEYELTNERNDIALNIAQVVYQFSPRHPETLLTLAKCLIACGHSDDAAKILQQVPQDIAPQLQVLRLQILRQVPDDELLHEEINSAFAQNPDHPDICYLEAKTLAENGDFDGALALMGKIFQGEDVNAEHHKFAGWLHNELGNLDKAVLHLNQAIQFNPQDVELLLLLATVHLKRRETKKALSVYQNGIEATPDDYRFYYEAGRLLRELKQYSDAEFMFRKASQLAPERKDIRNQLGAIMALNFVHNAK